jgi:hypothetical protein
VDECSLGVEQVELNEKEGDFDQHAVRRCHETKKEERTFWSSRAQAEAMAVVLESMQSDRETLAVSPPGTSSGGWLQIPSLKPVGHQSTNWMVLLVLIEAMAALQSLGTTSPR